MITNFKRLTGLFAVFSILFLSACQEDGIEDRPSSLTIQLPTQIEGWYNETLSLDASGTRDATDLPITYLWEAVSFPGDHFISNSLEGERSSVAKFTPLNIGEYVFKLTASTEFEKQEARISVSVEAEMITIRGNQNGLVETWRQTTPEGMPDYRIEGPVFLNDSEITVEEGVIIEMAENASLTVNTGSFFNATGTSDQPIVIKGQEETRAYWGSLRFGSGSANNRLVHVHISDGGRNRNNDRGMVTFTSDSRLHMEQCKLSNAQGGAVELGVVTSRSDIHLTHIQNDYKNNERSIYARPDNFHLLDSESDYTGNDLDAIGSDFSFANLAGNGYTWQKLNVPYHVGRLNINGDLTLEPGVVIKMGANADIQVPGNGSLIAEGTAGDPIVIEGFEDQPTYWKGIYINGNASNVLNHVEVKGAGSGTLTSGAPLASLLMRGGRLNIDNTKFIDGGNNLAIAYFITKPTITMGPDISVVNMPDKFSNIE